jgi:hypothetical protein
MCCREQLVIRCPLGSRVAHRQHPTPGGSCPAANPMQAPLPRVSSVFPPFVFRSDLRARQVWPRRKPRGRSCRCIARFDRCRRAEPIWARHLASQTEMNAKDALVMLAKAQKGRRDDCVEARPVSRRARYGRCQRRRGLRPRPCHRPSHARQGRYLTTPRGLRAAAPKRPRPLRDNSEPGAISLHRTTKNFAAKIDQWLRWDGLTARLPRAGRPDRCWSTTPRSPRTCRSADWRP